MRRKLEVALLASAYLCIIQHPSLERHMASIGCVLPPGWWLGISDGIKALQEILILAPFGGTLLEAYRI